MNYALSHVSTFLYAQPITATLMRWILPSEQLTLSLVLGLWLVERGR